jgi:peptidoglycan hydrolase CwlO-like protein
MGASRRFFTVSARRAGGVLVALALVGGLTSWAGADTRSQLDAAKARLTRLEAGITAQQQQAADLQARMRDLAERLALGRVRYQQLGRHLSRIQAALAEAEARYLALRFRLDRRARALFMQGAGSELEFILGATSLRNLTDRLQITNRMSAADAAMADQVAELATALKRQNAKVQDLRGAQARTLALLNAQSRALAAAFAAQQHILASLIQSRQQVGALVSRLRTRLRKEELLAAQALLGSGMNATYGQWAATLIRALGVSACRDNMVVIVAWEANEGTSASWNPLDTTLKMPGSTTYNSVGVQNYRSEAQGLQATMNTLHETGLGYAAILSDLARCAPAMTTGWAVNASMWCRGCNGGTYVVGFIPAVEAYYSAYAGR